MLILDSKEQECRKHKVKILVGNVGLTISKQAPAELVEGGQGEERAVGV